MPRHRRPRRPQRYQRSRQQSAQPASSGTSALFVLALAAIGGGLIGTGVAVARGVPISALVERARPVAVSLGFARQRIPQPGDYWSGCTAARAAGTAPIYLGEPGYRDEMDGDSDGIACEPYRGAHVDGEAARRG